MIYIDRKKIPTPDIFFSEKVRIARKNLEDFYNQPKSKSEKKFTRPFEKDIKNEFTIFLRELFNNKCAYCESHITLDASNEYDHFRPKNGARGFEKEFSNEHYWWLTYEWRNIYYACQNCNRYKSTWFPVEGNRIKLQTPYNDIILNENCLLVDPCVDQPEKHLLFKENGEVDFLTPKGKVTIEILKLNRSELVKSREDILTELYSEWERFLSHWKNRDKNWEYLKIIAREWVSILNNSSSKSYLAAQKQMLAKWIANYDDINNYFKEGQYEWKLETRRLDFSNSVDIIDSISSQELNQEEKKHIEETINTASLKHIYLERLELENFKCFPTLTISFNNSVTNENNLDSSFEPWVLFLGENGVGKSSILKAISIALMGEVYIKKLGKHLAPNDLLTHEANKGSIKLYLLGETKPIEVTFSRDDVSIKTTAINPLTYLVGYGSIRLLPNNKIQPEKGRFQAVKVENLYDYSISLSNANDWLLKISNKHFESAVDALKDLMFLDDGDDIIRVDKEIFIIKNKERFPIAELSDGYQSVYAIAVDIMSTLVKENVPFYLAEGVVLIDEIGTHLHPRWKMHVVKQLRKVFRKMQFVVTTHEPLCLRGLMDKEVIVLIKNVQGEICAVTELPDPSKLRVDQILTSPFFGLQSAIDEETEDYFDKYYDLLSKETLAPEEEILKLELSDKIPKMKYLGNTLREELAIYVIDELLAKSSKGAQLNKSILQLKEEAKNRVKSIWDNIDQERNNNDIR